MDFYISATNVYKYPSTYGGIFNECVIEGLCILEKLNFSFIGFNWRQNVPICRTFLCLIAEFNTEDFLIWFFMWLKIQSLLRFLKKYTQNIYKSCVKNLCWSYFYFFYQLDLIFYKHKRIVRND